MEIDLSGYTPHRMLQPRTLVHCNRFNQFKAYFKRVLVLLLLCTVFKVARLDGA